MTRRQLRILAAGALAVVACLALLPAASSREGLATLAVLGGMGVVGMILDSRNEFADATALNTGGAGTYLVGNQANLAVARGIGALVDTPLFLVISVDTTATSGGSATVQFVLASDAQAAIATDGSATEHFRTAAYPVASLVKGFTVNIPVPPPPPEYEQYLGILQVTAVAALTAGKINAFLTTTPVVNTPRPDLL